MLSLVKKTVGLSTLYASGDILVKGIGLLLLPIYTAYLTPSDYGILAVANVVSRNHFDIGPEWCGLAILLRFGR